MSGVTVQEVYLARQRLRELIRRTPIVRSAWLSELTGADVWLKLESLQVGHAFKVRGAFNAVAHLMEAAGSGQSPPSAVVTASAGNHGMALAWAAHEADLPAVIFTPRTAASTKLDAIRRMGADLRAVAEDYDDAERMAVEHAARENAAFISPYDHRDVVAGGGTVGLEIVEDLPSVDAIVVPVGGGGLISGIATVTAAITPRVRVVGVEAAVNPAFKTALANDRITAIPVLPTLADGLSGNVSPATMTFDIIRTLVTDITYASEAELERGIRHLLGREHLVAEGAGVAAVAAVMAGRGVRPGERTAVVVSGANIDVMRLREVLNGAS